MNETFVYLSEQWRDEAERRLQETLTPDDTKNASISMTNCSLNCPDGSNRFVHYSFVDGKLETMAVGEGDEGPESDITITADYSVFVKIVRKELSGQMAMMTGKLKLKGNMAKVMKYAPLSQLISDIVATIPTDYQC